jgi:intracellular sulfur oxidation DsrE/DsrF family protein
MTPPQHRRSKDERPKSRATRRGVIKAGLLAALASPSAAKAAERQPGEGPFVEHRLALQLSDREPAKQALVLSVANNLLKEYGPDRIAIEVVAFGPGIDLLQENAPERTRVDSLVSQGVRFDVCMNTIDTIERETGAKVALNPSARPVRAGVAQLLALAEQGYTLVRP